MKWLMKLIEIALSLQAINIAPVHEKANWYGRLSMLQVRWARRPFGTFSLESER